MSAMVFGKFGRTCAVCGKRKPQAWWSAKATCGRICGLAWKRERQAANRPDSLAAKGVGKLDPFKAYAMGYQAGYARARYRYAQRAVA